MVRGKTKMSCLKKIGITVCAVVLTISMQVQVLAGSYMDVCNDYEWEVLKLVNKERIADGKEAISTFDKLQKAAHVRTREIASVFDHTRPNGTSCFTVLKQNGVSFMAAGENIASGQSGPQEVMNSWMNSSGHRANILQPAFHHIGIGYGTTGLCGNSWVECFVGGCGVTDIRVNASAQSYPVGSSIDSMNRYLIITCSNHGESYAPVISSMCSGYKSGQSGKQSVTVKYQGHKITMNVSLGKGSAGGDSQDNGTSDGDASGAASFTKPAKVTNFTVKKGNTNVYKLTWKKQKCSGYEIWRADSSNKKFKKIKTLTKATKNSYTVSTSKLKNGVKYYYKVRAYNKKNKKVKYGSFSARKTITKSI